MPPAETEEEKKKRLEPIIATRMRERDEWAAFWKIMEHDSRGHIFKRIRYFMWQGLDIPATWWREKIIEPLQDKYGHWPYYHRRFKRVPTVDECHVNDQVCYHEAQMQYRLDKVVDNRILWILRKRRDDCISFHNDNMDKCLQQMEDFEEAELNWYIKYGEMGFKGDVLTCYMKQKHRMIWERRNPAIMAERQKAYEEHKKLFAQGIYDHWFWKRGMSWLYKDYRPSIIRGSAVLPYTSHEFNQEEHAGTVSLDPEYYRQKKEDDGKTKIASPWDVLP